MKKISFEIKFLLVFILCGILIFATLFVYKSIKNAQLKAKSFQFYEYHNFSNNISNISKADLIDDTYLISLLRINNYNGVIEKENINDVLMYYLFNFTKNTAEEIILKDGAFDFCMATNSFKKSFIEFFDYDISNSLNLLEYVDFIKYSNDLVCFNLDEEVMYDYYTLIGIDNIQSNGEIINAKIYLYDNDFETKQEEEKFKNSLINSLNSNNLISFNKTLSNYEEKIIKFKEIPNGDFFKYQVLYVTTRKSF